MKIPLCRPYVDEAEIQAVSDVLASGWYAHGPANRDFEQAFAQYLGVKHAVTLNSCTSALQIALQARQITGEVLIPSFTWVATANSVITAGATPVFVEVDPVTRCMDPDDAARRITPRTQAIMPVHYGGQCADMTRLGTLAQQHNLTLVEDSAETLGGTHHGKQAGAFGIGCFSFFPTKNITTGEGGMLTTDDDDVAAFARAISSHGLVKSTFDRETQKQAWHKEAHMPGYNFRMPNILAAIGVEQMKKLATMNQRRRELAARYDHHFASRDDLTPPVEAPGNHHVYQMYTILVPQPLRDPLVHALNDQGIQAGVHFYPPVHRHACYRQLVGDINLPHTDALAERIVTLPIYPGMTMQQVDQVAQAVLANLDANV